MNSGPALFITAFLGMLFWRLIFEDLYLPAFLVFLVWLLTVASTFLIQRLDFEIWRRRIYGETVDTRSGGENERGK